MRKLDTLCTACAKVPALYGRKGLCNRCYRAQRPKITCVDCGYVRPRESADKCASCCVKNARAVCVGCGLSKRVVGKKMCWTCRNKHISKKPCSDCGKEARLRSGFCSMCKNRRDQYGLSFAAFNELLAKQNHTCPLCLLGFENEPYYVDHNHATGAVRGILHNICNSALGPADKHGLDWLNRAHSYLSVNTSLRLLG